MKERGLNPDAPIFIATKKKKRYVPDSDDSFDSDMTSQISSVGSLYQEPEQPRDRRVSRLLTVSRPEELNESVRQQLLDVSNLDPSPLAGKTMKTKTR